MSRILKRSRAQDDIADIWTFIADASTTRADAFIEMLDQKFRMIAENPGLGRARDELAKGLRSFPAGRYVIFYSDLVDGIEIVRVLHGARDLDTIFRADE